MPKFRQHEDKPHLAPEVDLGISVTAKCVGGFTFIHPIIRYKIIIY